MSKKDAGWIEVKSRRTRDSEKMASKVNAEPPAPRRSPANQPRGNEGTQRNERPHRRRSERNPERNNKVEEEPTSQGIHKKHKE